MELKLKAWICDQCRKENALDVFHCEACGARFPALVEFTFHGTGTPEEQARLVRQWFGYDINAFAFDDSGEFIGRYENDDSVKA